MKNKIVLLRSDNIILKVLDQFRTLQQAKWFIEDNYPDFLKMFANGVNFKVLSLLQ